MSNTSKHANDETAKKIKPEKAPKKGISISKRNERISWLMHNVEYWATADKSIPTTASNGLLWSSLSLSDKMALGDLALRSHVLWGRTYPITMDQLVYLDNGMVAVRPGLLDPFQKFLAQAEEGQDFWGVAQAQLLQAVGGSGSGRFAAEESALWSSFSAWARTLLLSLSVPHTAQPHSPTTPQVHGQLLPLADLWGVVADFTMGTVHPDLTLAWWDDILREGREKALTGQIISDVGTLSDLFKARFSPKPEKATAVKIEPKESTKTQDTSAPSSVAQFTQALYPHAPKPTSRADDPLGILIRGLFPNIDDAEWVLTWCEKELIRSTHIFSLIRPEDYAFFPLGIRAVLRKHFGHVKLGV